MWPHAKLRLDIDTASELADQVVVVGHGDLIGRMSSASLRLDDPRISEAHAMVSLRGGELYLLALRRRFFVDSELRSEVVLGEGLSVVLADGVGFVVEELNLANTVLGLRLPSGESSPLLGVCSLMPDEAGGLVSSYRRGASAYLFNRDEDWLLQVAGREPRPVHAGDRFEVEGQRYEITNLPLRRAGAARTAPDQSQGALVIIVHPTRTRILRRGRGHALDLSGIAARIIHGLVTHDGPASWSSLAHTLWPADLDDAALRQRWDMNLSRLRAKLRRADIRINLVRSDGRGHVELFLLPGDDLQTGT